MLTGAISVSAEMNQVEDNNFFVAKIIELINREREKVGVGKLSANQVLNMAARFKAEDMIAKDYFSHTTLDGHKPWDLVDRSLYPYILIGENLAMNFIAADDAHSALMASPLHQKNILNPKFNDIGLAVINGEMSGKNTNVLVQIFGSQTTIHASVNEPSPVVEPIVEISQTEEIEVKPLADSVVAGNSSEPDIINPVNTDETKLEINDIKKEDNAVIEQQKIDQVFEEAELEMQVIDDNNSKERENVIEEKIEEISGNNLINNKMSDDRIEESERGVFDEKNNSPSFENQPENYEILVTERVYANLESNSRISRTARTVLIVKNIFLLFIVILIISFLINIFIPLPIETNRQSSGRYY